ncbi:recombinase family protein [Microbacterium sp. zg.B48]|uniref:recombinase family protein n=1 Tax=Microbacterium sp. zg.B48 TaxID=2969408 RepID=UPI00214B9992|nr:recombinase family protein [Microbacterium sp. zg.B48]MCR2762064.1 recombinase family protein [Microbacterium sp. zg.B48]
MNALLIGYARVSTYEQDLTAQRTALEKLGVDAKYIHTDHQSMLSPWRARLRASL